MGGQHEVFPQIEKEFGLQKIHLKKVPDKQFLSMTTIIWEQGRKGLISVLEALLVRQADGSTGS